MATDVVADSQIFEEFRLAVKDLERNDGTLRRFLKARNHEIPPAEKMLRNTCEWRRTHNVNEALTWEIPNQICEVFPIEYPGVDYKNQAIMSIPLGIWPVREMVEAGNKDVMVRYIVVCIEKLVQEIEKTGERFTLVLDMEGMKFWTYAHYDSLQTSLEVFRTFEAHYPERLDEALVINTPFIFQYGWNFVKPLLTGSTLSKVKFLGSNESKYLPAILERMPLTSMPLKLQKLAKQKHNFK